MNAKTTFSPTTALRHLPPYVFAELDRLKNDARAEGVRLIDLGIGSPDLPISPAIINALTKAARGRQSHGYPHFRGAARYLDSIGHFMRSRFGVTIDPKQQGVLLLRVGRSLAFCLKIFSLPLPRDLAPNDKFQSRMLVSLHPEPVFH